MNTESSLVRTRSVAVVSMAVGLLFGIFADELFAARLIGPMYSQSAAVFGTLFQNWNGPTSNTAAATIDSSSTTVATTSTTTTASSTESLSSLNNCPDTAPTPPPRYAYKLVYDVDPCKFNRLGADGWTPLQYGVDQSNNQYIESAAGRDETCSRAGIYSDFIWVLFQKTLQ